MSEVVEEQLENGLRVLIRESHAAPVVSCWVGYRVGARNERPGITGASHWVEHMTFKGTARLGAGDIFRYTARHGGANNGFTTDDLTIYYETLPSAQLETALLIESERMGHALFEEEETERERTVILAERSGAENNPHFELSERMASTVFQEHPYRWPVIGLREDLETMTRADLYGHYRSFYAPGNAVLAIVGDVHPEQALRQAAEYFGPIPAGPPVSSEQVKEPEQTGERRVEVRKPGASSYVQVAYHIPTVGHPDFYPLVMLDALLSGGKSVSWGGGGYMGRTARLYTALVQTGLAVSGGSAVRYTLDPYAFTLSMTVRAGVLPSEAEKALLEVVEGVAALPPTEEELARILRQTEAQFAYSRDGVTSQAFALLFFDLLDHWSFADRHIERLTEVTPQDVARVASTYLTPANRTVGWFIPT